MRKLIVASIAFVLLLGGFIVYVEIDKRKFVDNILAVSPVVDQPVNVIETTREVTRANGEPKFQEVDTDELLDAVNRIPEQFGYSEASTTYAKLETKRMSGEQLTIDEEVARLEAKLYLYPNEATRKSLIVNKWLQSKGPSYDDVHSDQAIAELKELGIPVVYRGDAMIINPFPDYIRRDLAEEDADGEPRDSASDAVFSEGIGEDTDFLPARSEEIPVNRDPDLSGEDEYAHEQPTSPPPAPPAAKSVEDSGRAGLSRVQQELVKQFFDEYGTEKGLRLLREMDPDTAERFERDRIRAPSRDVPKADGSVDEVPVSDSP